MEDLEHSEHGQECGKAALHNNGLTLMKRSVSEWVGLQDTYLNSSIRSATSTDMTEIILYLPCGALTILGSCGSGSDL